MNIEDQQQAREEIKNMVSAEEKESVSTAPIVTSIPIDAVLKGAAVRWLPEKVRGFACAFVTMAGILIVIVIAEDNLEQAYLHHKPLVRAAAVKASDFKDEAVKDVVLARVPTNEFWRDPLLPYLPTPNHAERVLVMPAGTSNTASTPVTHYLYSSGSIGITGSARIWVIDADGVIKADTKKPLT